MALLAQHILDGFACGRQHAPLDEGIDEERGPSHRQPTSLEMIHVVDILGALLLPLVNVLDSDHLRCHQHHCLAIDLVGDPAEHHRKLLEREPVAIHGYALPVTHAIVVYPLQHRKRIIYALTVEIDISAELWPVFHHPVAT